MKQAAHDFQYGRNRVDALNQVLKEIKGPDNKGKCLIHGSFYPPISIRTLHPCSNQVH